MKNIYPNQSWKSLFPNGAAWPLNKWLFLSIHLTSGAGIFFRRVCQHFLQKKKHVPTVVVVVGLLYRNVSYTSPPPCNPTPVTQHRLCQQQCCAPSWGRFGMVTTTDCLCTSAAVHARQRRGRQSMYVHTKKKVCGKDRARWWVVFTGGGCLLWFYFQRERA